MVEISEKIGVFLKEQGFALDLDDLRQVADVFATEAERALSGAPSSLLMLDAHLSGDLIKGPSHSSSVIVVDAGGTNLRVAVVRFTGEGPIFSCVRKSEMPGTRGPVSADDFHAAIAAEVEAVRSEEPQASAIGYCFSYSCRPLPDGDAELICWSKQIDAPEVVGQRVGAELARHLSGEPLPIVVLNDTVATLLAGLSRPGRECPGQIGFILGPGRNLACIENGMIRNAETGECDKVPHSPSDEAHDATLPDRGAAPFEKMVSGAYLGGVGQQLFRVAAEVGLLPQNRFDGNMLSTCDLDELGMAEDDPVVRELARAVFRRAAVLTAAHLAAFVRRSAEGGRVPVRITVDGSTYWKTQSVDFDGLVRRTLAELVPEIPFEIFRVDEAPMVGAAVAAVLSR